MMQLNRKAGYKASGASSSPNASGKRQQHTTSSPFLWSLPVSNTGKKSRYHVYGAIHTCVFEYNGTHRTLTEWHMR